MQQSWPGSALTRHGDSRWPVLKFAWPEAVQEARVTARRTGVKELRYSRKGRVQDWPVAQTERRIEAGLAGCKCKLELNIEQAAAGTNFLKRRTLKTMALRKFREFLQAALGFELKPESLSAVIERQNAKGIANHDVLDPLELRGEARQLPADGRRRNKSGLFSGQGRAPT